MPAGRAAAQAVTGCACEISSVGATQMFMTPSTGACQAKRLPSGDNFGSIRDGLPSSRLRGIKGHSSVFGPVIDTVDFLHPGPNSAWAPVIAAPLASF